MHDATPLILAGPAGFLLGAIFFGGLWWTVGKGISSPRPALWFMGSLVVRTTIALAGFYAVSDGDWRRLPPCLLGFALARPVIGWLTRPPGKTRSGPLPEASHAP
jgi:F1F0 ATPase subunit 2